jgi:hypothetical protein
VWGSCTGQQPNMHHCRSAADSCVVLSAAPPLPPPRPPPPPHLRHRPGPLNIVSLQGWQTASGSRAGHNQDGRSCPVRVGPDRCWSRYTGQLLISTTAGQHPPHPPPYGATGTLKVSCECLPQAAVACCASQPVRPLLSSMSDALAAARAYMSLQYADRRWGRGGDTQTCLITARVASPTRIRFHDQKKTKALASAK